MVNKRRTSKYNFFIVFFSIVFLCCKNTKDTNCAQILRYFYLVNFEKDEIKDLSLKEVSSKNGERYITDFCINELTERDMVTFEVFLDSPAFFDGSKLVVTIQGYEYVISEVDYNVLERKTMFTTINDCEIQKYKINGVVQKERTINIIK